MLTHEACKQRLPAYRANNLSEGEANEVAGHLMACAECGDAFDALQTAESGGEEDVSALVREHAVEFRDAIAQIRAERPVVRLPRRSAPAETVSARVLQAVETLVDGFLEAGAQPQLVPVPVRGAAASPLRSLDAEKVLALLGAGERIRFTMPSGETVDVRRLPGSEGNLEILGLKATNGPPLRKLGITTVNEGDRDPGDIRWITPDARGRFIVPVAMMMNGALLHLR
jgi:hypothetical protein